MERYEENRGKTYGNRGNRGNRRGRRLYQDKRSNIRNNRGREYEGKKRREKYEKPDDLSFNRTNTEYDYYPEDEIEEDDYNNNYNKDNYYNNNYNKDNYYNDNYNYNNKKSYKKNYSKKNYYNNNNDKNNNFKSDQKKTFFKKIKELSQKEDINDLIISLYEDDNLYNEINNTNFKKESCYLLMKIIRNISENNSEPALKIINNIIQNTNLFQKTVNKFINGEEVIYDDDEYLDFLYNVIEFLKNSLIKTTVSSNINLNINNCKGMIEQILKDKKDINGKEKMSKIINKINDYENQKNIINYEKYKKKKKKKKENDKYYKDVDVIINPEEFFLDKKYNIDSNKIKGPYESYEKYINTMFFLELL